MKRDRLLLAAFFLSGVAALGYEILWTRLLALTLGSETLGVLGTLAGFFGGLAVGSWALHGAAKHSRSPVRLFALLELITAGYALVSPHLLLFLARTLPPVLGPAAGDNDTPLALVLCLATAILVLLPGTVPMGATLAALVEARRRAVADGDEGRGLGRLYGANTFGATAGVLLAVHLVLPRLGMAWGAVALAAVGVAGAGLALMYARARGIEFPRYAITSPGNAPPTTQKQEEPEGAEPDGSGGGASRQGRYSVARDFNPSRVSLLLFGTGLAGVGLEVVGVQILAQPLEDTIYTFADILAVYLLGTAAGAWLYGRLAGKLGRPRSVTAALLIGHAASVALTASLLPSTPALLARIAPEGAGAGARMAAEFVVAALAFGVPTLLMGALASHLLAQTAAEGVGRPYAANTLGGTLAPFVFGLAATPLLGYGSALKAVGVVYLALIAVTAWRARAPWVWGGAAAAVLLLALAPRRQILVELPPGSKELATRETLMGLVRVTEHTGGALAGSRTLQVNKHFHMGGGSAFGERRLGHIPLLLAPDAKSTLFLGVATGATLSAVRHYPLERVEAVELVPVMLDLMPLFSEINDDVASDPKVRLHAADARRFVAASRDRFDVVVADLFHPARDGAGTLYAREHFATVRAHLAPGGLFAQWIPLYQFDPPNLKTVVRTFLAVFPEVHSWLGIDNAETPALVLVGRVPASAEDRLSIDVPRLAATLARPVYRDLSMQDPRDLLGAYMLDRAALAAYAGEGPENTDLYPRVLFDAPRTVYENRPDLAVESLVSLLPYRCAVPPTLLSGLAEDERAAFAAEVASVSRAAERALRDEIAAQLRAADDRI